MSECDQCGNYEVVLDEKAGHMVCDYCGVISEERVVAHDYERNKDYNGEHFALPTAAETSYNIKLVDGKLREIELKSNRTKFLKEWVARLKQPDVHEFPMDVLEYADKFIDILETKDYLRMKKDIILLHVLGAVLYLAHESLDSPVEKLHIKDVFQFTTVVPVSRQITTIRTLLNIRQPELTEVHVFEYSLRKALRKLLDKKIPVGPEMMRTVNHRVSRIMTMWRTIYEDKQYELLMSLQANPTQCIYLYDHYLRPKMRKTCRKECVKLHDNLVRLDFDFEQLKQTSQP